jgi:hypothetical protein
MSYINKFDNRGCHIIDKIASDLFMDMCLKKGVLYNKASRDEDMFEHWDYRIEAKDIDWKIDLKGMKRINSKDTVVDDSLLLIELNNVNGDMGWVYGKADYIVFLIRGAFLFVKREKIVEYLEKNIDLDQEVCESTDDKKPYIMYQRKQTNRKDRFIYLPKREIVKLADKCWKL